MPFTKKQTHRKLTITNEPYHYDENFPLLSIHVASNRSDQIKQFVENIHSNCHNKNAYEIIVKVDAEDPAMIKCLNELSAEYGISRVKSLIRPRKAGPWSLWEFYNEQYLMSHEKAYFMCLFSDEVRINTKDWDLVLKKYIGLYEDNVFRLKLSDNRLRNFYKLDEVLRLPDNFPFITRKWMDICGLWGDCHSPDTFQQAVSFHLGKLGIFRDVPIFDIEISGLEAGLLLPPEKMFSRAQNIRKLWANALSKPMRSRYIAHSTKLKFFIESCKKGAQKITFHEKTSYPSEVICSNDIGEKEFYKCPAPEINMHGLSLLLTWFKFSLHTNTWNTLVTNICGIAAFLTGVKLFSPSSSSFGVQFSAIALMFIGINLTNFDLAKKIARYFYRNLKKIIRKDNSLSHQVWRQLAITDEAYHHDDKSPLVSIFVQPGNTHELFEMTENIHSCCFNKNAYEIIIKINSEDPMMISCVRELSARYGEQRIKFFIDKTNKQTPDMIASLYNEHHSIMHKKAYFVMVLSDKARILTYGWDQILKKYIGISPDHVFRLNLSAQRLRNYYQIEDALQSPNDFSLMSRKYFDICGIFGDAASSSLIYQATSWYLGKENVFCDIPVLDIELTTNEKSGGIQNNPEKIIFDKQIQSFAILQAKKLKFFVESYKEGARKIKFHEKMTYPSAANCENDKNKNIITYNVQLNGIDMPGIKYFIKKCLILMKRCIPFSFSGTLFIGCVLGLITTKSLFVSILCIFLMVKSIRIARNDYLKTWLN